VIKRADALVIVLDMSASMLAADVQPSRVQRARQKVLDLLDTRKEGVTGLVVFAGDAHVVTPLTDDTRTIANLMPALSPAMMPLPGANAVSAIEMAAELLITAGAQGGQILLMTDGLPGFDPDAVKAALENSGATLSILAIGTPSGAPIPLPNGGFLKDDAGEIVIPALDRAAISAIAAEVNAVFGEITLDEADIEALTQRDLLVSEGELDLDRQTDAWQDQGYWLAALVALLMLPAFRRGAIASIALLVVFYAQPPEAAEWQDLWLTPDQQGAQQLANGQAADAAATFRDPAWRGVAAYEAGTYDQAARSFAGERNANSLYNLNANSLYNLGNALALQGDLRGALSAYEKSLSELPDAEDAIANRDFIQSLLDQQEQESQDQQGDEQNQEDSAPQDDSESENDQQDQSESSESEGSEQEPGDGTENESGNEDQQQSTDEQREQDSALADAPERDQEALDAATEEQMAKFDEALEEQQALEQWLRRVPDDPGGLLRRKFRYQTMQRLREGEEPDESIRW